MASDVAQVVGPVRAIPTLTTTGAPASIVVAPIGNVWDAYKRSWSLTVRVDYLGMWEPVVEDGATWITVERSYANKLLLSLAENVSGAARSATVTVQSVTDPEEKAVVTISQSTENPVKFGLSEKAITLPASGEPVQFELTSKPSARWAATCLVDWAWVQGIVTPAAETENGEPVWDWKYNGMGKASLRAVAKPNTSTSPRTVKVKFVQDVEEVILTVTQEGAAPEEDTAAAE